VIQAGGPVSFEQAQRAAQLDAIRPVLAAQKIQSLVAVPLMDGQENVGIIILEQCITPRAFRKVDEVVLSTIAEQIVMAVNNARLRSLVKNLAVTDDKSGLLRRASYLDVLISEVQRSLPQKTPVTLALLNFGSSSALTKEVGETAVEAAMQEVGQAVLANIRQNDTAIHYGQCSIAIILSDTNEKSAVPAIEKLRKTASSVRLSNRTEPLVLSAGIAELQMQPKFDAVDIVTEAINRVESALEVARQEGGRVRALPAIFEDIPA
jgi:diguanylate cyclase (GGDEF)-like protein